MKINRIIFAIVLIALCMLSCVDLKKSKKRSYTNTHSRAFVRYASQLANQFYQFQGQGGQMGAGGMKKDIFAWKKDRFLRPLKDEPKYKRTANTTNKWTLFQFLVGKTFALMGLEPSAVFKWVTKLRQPQLLKIVVLFMRFQQSMNFDELKPLLDMKNKPPGLNAGTLLPTFKERIMTFLDRHIRKRPQWY